MNDSPPDRLPDWVPGWLPDFSRPRRIVVLRWVIVLVLVLALLAFVVKGANNPKDPTLAPPGALRTVVVDSPI